MIFSFFNFPTANTIVINTIKYTLNALTAILAHGNTKLTSAPPAAMPQ